MFWFWLFNFLHFLVEGVTIRLYFWWWLCWFRIDRYDCRFLCFWFIQTPSHIIIIQIIPFKLINSMIKYELLAQITTIHPSFLLFSKFVGSHTKFCVWEILSWAAVVHLQREKFWLSKNHPQRWAGTRVWADRADHCDRENFQPTPYTSKSA